MQSGRGGEGRGGEGRGSRKSESSYIYILYFDFLAGGTPRNFWWGCAARFSSPFSHLASKIHNHFQTWFLESIPVSVKSILIFRPKWLNSVPYFRPKRLKNQTLWGSTYLYSLYRKLSPPPPRDGVGRVWGGGGGCIVRLCTVALLPQTRNFSLH